VRRVYRSGDTPKQLRTSYANAREANRVKESSDLGKTSCSTIRKIGIDSAFPHDVFRESYKEMMGRVEKEGITRVAFGHLGNCHIHINDTIK